MLPYATLLPSVLIICHLSRYSTAHVIRHNTDSVNFCIEGPLLRHSDLDDSETTTSIELCQIEYESTTLEDAIVRWKECANKFGVDVEYLAWRRISIICGKACHNPAESLAPERVNEVPCEITVDEGSIGG